MGVAEFLIPYEDMLMLISSSAYLSEVVVDLLTRYEEKLVLFLIQHICQRGWRMLISYENKWVWLPHLTNLSKGVVDLLIPFEDELMWLPHAKCYSDGVVDVWSFLKISWCDYTIQFHSTYLAEALVDLWSFLKISWCDYTIQHICHRGGKFLIPFEYKTYK